MRASKRAVKEKGLKMCIRTNCAEKIVEGARAIGLGGTEVAVEESFWKLATEKPQKKIIYN